MMAEKSFQLNKKLKSAFLERWFINLKKPNKTVSNDK